MMFAENGRLADAKRERTVDQAETRAGHRADEHDQGKRREGRRRQLDPEQQAADRQREGGDERAVQHHRHGPAEEERQAAERGRRGSGRASAGSARRAIAKPIANTQGIAAYCSAFPIT